MCNTCTDPQLCRDTNTCIKLKDVLLDEMTRIAQENGEYDRLRSKNEPSRRLDFVFCDDCIDPMDCGSWCECLRGKSGYWV